MGQKRKPWSPEEDKVLIDFITNHGHENWRALPKQTGLLRCGRSCRFRWLNYLRYDIKRGNFSIEEEDEIIKLHESLGNKWSAIAARVPGRTDNEIKNAWNTRLKKKLKKNNTSSGSPEYRQGSKCETSDAGEGEPVNSDAQLDHENLSCDTLSPPQSPSEFSSGTDTSSSMATVDNQGMSREDEYYASSHDIFHVDENFSTDSMVTQQQTCYFPNSSNMNDDMDFWLELYLNAGEQLNVGGNFSPSTEIDTQKQTCFSPYRSNMNDNTDFWLDLYLNAREQPVSGNKSLAEDRIDNSDIRWSPNRR